MNQNINIRYATKEDIHFIVDANYSMAYETENLRLDRKALKAGVTAVFEDSGKGRYLVAEIRGNVVGCLLTTYEWSDWRNKTTVWIQSLYVLPEYRGQGAFKAMFAHIQEQVTAGEFAGVRLYVDSTNQKAQEVYKRLGMNGDHYQLFEKMAE